MFHGAFGLQLKNWLGVDILKQLLFFRRGKHSALHRTLEVFRENRFPAQGHSTSQGQAYLITPVMFLILQAQAFVEWATLILLLNGHCGFG